MIDDTSSAWSTKDGNYPSFVDSYIGWNGSNNERIADIEQGDIDDKLNTDQGGKDIKTKNPPADGDRSN